MCRSDKNRGTNSTGVKIVCCNASFAVLDGGTPNKCWSRYCTKLISMRSHTVFGEPKHSCVLNRDDVYSTNSMYHCNSNVSPRSATADSHVWTSSSSSGSAETCCRNKSIIDLESFVWGVAGGCFVPRTSAEHSCWQAAFAAPANARMTMVMSATE